MDQKKYGLIGKTLQHSFSKDYFKKKFENLGLKDTYDNYECKTIHEVKGVLGSDVSGFNVTIPYKETIIPLLSELDPVASAVQAVNTLKRVNGKWVGYNTDVYGFRQSLKPFLTNQHDKAIVLGTGGASKAVKYVLKSIGIEVFSISRMPEEGEYSYDDISEQMIKFCHLIINTTPLGMFPKVNQAPDIPYHSLTPQHLLVDLIYNPEQSLFLSKGASNGAQTMNGKSMLRLQAEKSWEIWNNEHLI